MEKPTIDNEMVQVFGDIAQAGIDRIFMHLRDAREAGRGANIPLLAKATVILSCAALESNLAHLTQRALAAAKARPQLYSREQLEYLSGTKQSITDRGAVRDVRLRQSLEERLQVVPDLLARAIGRRYALPKTSSAIRKLRRTIELRDAIIHPRWDRYLPLVTADEAAQSIDAVELYLHSIQMHLHPYMVGYIGALMTIRGHDKHDVAIGHRTAGKRVRKSSFLPMTDVGIVEVMLQEWFSMPLVCRMAFEGGTEGDSAGSLLTRVAIVLLFAGLNSQLSILAQWKLHDATVSFETVERHFLEENVVGIGRDGEAEVTEDHQGFKQRVIAVPAILARRVEGLDIDFNLGTRWGEQLQKSYTLRNYVVHAPPDQPLARVTRRELYDAATAIKSYFQALVVIAPETFKIQGLLLDDFRLPTEAEVSAM